MRFSHLVFFIGLLLFLVFSRAGGAMAQSAIVVPAPSYSANDILLNRAPDSFASFGSNLAMFQPGTGPNSGLQIVNPADGSTLSSLGKPSAYLGLYPGMVWNSFVAADPSGTSVWVGFTNYGDTDDRVYQVDLNGNWTERAKLAGNFDMQVSGTNAYLVGNATGMTAGNAAIWQLDTISGNLAEVAEVGGYSVGLGADSQGNVYCGTYELTPGTQTLYRYSAAQIAAAVGSQSPLAFGDAQKLADVENVNGLSDVEVDAAGNVVFNMNTSNTDFSTTNRIAIWNGVAGDGANYDVIGSDDGLGHWYSKLTTSGNVRSSGGKVYAGDYFNRGLALLVKTTRWCGGSETHSNWSTPENWTSGAAPQPNDVVSFVGALRVRPNNDFADGTVFGGVEWLDGTSPMTLVGNSIGLSGDVCNFGTARQKIDLPVTLVGPKHSFNAAMGDIELQQPIGEAVAGTGLAKLGDSALYLSAVNDYTGPTDIQAGTLVVTASGDIASDSAITVASGATLEIRGPGHILGVIGGHGTTFVDAGATLTATSITGDSLVIGAPQLTAVPEPGTFLMLLAVAAGMVCVGIRLRR
jgi:autotransporter-associated beta strand protein